LKKFQKPKIALLHEYYLYRGGAEKVLLTLSKIFPDADLFFLSCNKNLVEKDFPNRKYKSTFVDFLPFFKSSNTARGIYSKFLPIASETIDLRGYDIIISSSNSYIKGVISPEDAIHISYIHSPTRYIWDYYQQYLDEKKISKIPFFRFLIQLYFSSLRKWDQIASSRPDFLIANSKIVQSRIKKYYNRDSFLIYPPIEVEKIKPNFEKGNYFLVISKLRSFKRIDLVVKVFNDLGEDLIIIGDGPELENLRKISKENISFVGNVSDEEKFDYLQNSRAIITPTIEDFGMSPIEGMSAGKPVIAINSGGTSETIINGETGILFNEQTEESLMNAIQKFFEIEDSFDRKKIREYAEKFSEKRFEFEIKKFVEKVSNIQI